jgi:formamidopyrimidine-DNA glycosylase
VPELPDVAVYVEATAARVSGERLAGVRLGNPFVLRTFSPPLSELSGARVTGVSRLGKRVVLELEGERFVVIHLMIAGRLHWKEPSAKLAGKGSLAAFDFDKGTLTLTEAGSKRRASIHVVTGRTALHALAAGGVEVSACDAPLFREALVRENHTLKRALTDPRILSGIGNAYSDEILFRAKLSPVKLTSKLTPEESFRLFDAARTILNEWTARLREQSQGRFPEKVTAFRPEMAVHGRYGKPCPACGSPVQRIVHAENETNYCPACQTDGKLLADRALSRLLRGDWPKSLDEMEEHLAARRSRVGSSKAPRASSRLG